MHDIVVCSVLPTYLSIVLCIALWLAACNELTSYSVLVLAEMVVCASLVPRPNAAIVVSERDNKCACAHNLKMASYAMDNAEVALVSHPGVPFQN